MDSYAGTNLLLRQSLLGRSPLSNIDEMTVGRGPDTDTGNGGEGDRHAEPLILIVEDDPATPFHSSCRR